MGNVIDYVREYGRETFERRGWCQADTLVLAQLSYLKFDGLVPTIGERGRAVFLDEIDGRMDPGKVFSDKFYEKENKELWQAVKESRRFGTMACNYYRTRLEEETLIQFAAVTFFPQGSMPVVAFRGTDETILGWREDFYLAFREPIPSQQQSALYLNQVGCLLPGPFMVCGHSKGGNLAVYASMLANGQVRRRIAAVDCLDGPGFRPDFLKGPAYEEIRERVHRILPSSSLVGMLLQNYERYEVVKSSASGVMQHDGYTWQIEAGEFVRIPDIEKKQKRINEVLNRWIFSLSEDEIRTCVDTLFAVIQKTGASTVFAFAQDWKNNLRICLKAIRELDPETGRRLRQILKLLLEVTAGLNPPQMEKEKGTKEK